MLKTADSEYAFSSEIEKKEVIIEDKTCFIDVYEEMKTYSDQPRKDDLLLGSSHKYIRASILKPVCKIVTKRSVGFTAKILRIEEIKTQTETVYGIAGILVELYGYSSPITILPDTEANQLEFVAAQKGRIYVGSDHLYRITLEIMDFKTKTVTTGTVRQMFFDWIKLRVTVAQYPPVK